jgi:hypothetical protein
VDGERRDHGEMLYTRRRSGGPLAAAGGLGRMGERATGGAAALWPVVGVVQSLRVAAVDTRRAFDPAPASG